MIYETINDGIAAQEPCLWCGADLRGYGATQEAARTNLAEVAKAHQCKSKPR